MPDYFPDSVLMGKFGVPVLSRSVRQSLPGGR
jgi:hypothetical protein